MADRKTTPNILDDLMSAAPAGTQKPAASSLRIAEIRRDGGTQPRAGLDEAHVQDLIAAIAAGDELPPVDVVFDGTVYWLYDGYHRVEAHGRSGKYTVQAIIHQGTQQDAQWMSYAANSRHGLKRTNDDKRRQVIAALRHPNGASMSNREIARHVGVDEGTVRNYREQMTASAEIPQIAERQVTRGGQTYTQNTAKIGTNQPSRPQPQRDDAAEDAWTAKQQAPAPRQARPTLSDEALLSMMRHYWSESQLQAFAASADPLGACRRFIAGRQGGWLNEEARVDTRSGEVQIWLKASGEYWHRAADGVYTWDRWASLTISLLPQLLPAATGRPLMEVIKTDEELAAEAQAADIASRNAAADEAELQHQAAAAADVAFGMAPTRHAELVRILDAAMEALPEIGDMITQRQYCLSVVTTLGIMKKELLAAIAKTSAPTAELPAELVAAGWELHTMRGKHYAAVSVPTEEEPIRTQLRADIADTIRDAQYMHKSLRIGA